MLPPLLPCCLHITMLPSLLSCYSHNCMLLLLLPCYLTVMLPSLLICYPNYWHVSNTPVMLFSLLPCYPHYGHVIPTTVMLSPLRSCYPHYGHVIPTTVMLSPLLLYSLTTTVLPSLVFCVTRSLGSVALGIRIQPTFALVLMGYKLSYTNGLLYALSFCMLWDGWVWTVGHWVVLVKVIYCSKGRWVLFIKQQTASLRGDPELQPQS